MDPALADALAKDFAQNKLQAEEKQFQLQQEIKQLKQELIESTAAKKAATKKDIVLGQPKTSETQLNDEQKELDHESTLPDDYLTPTPTTEPNINSAWTHFCLMYCHLTWWQQISSWLVPVAGIILPFISSSTSAESSHSFLATILFCMKTSFFILFALAGYQGFAVVQHARQQIAALEKTHRQATGKNLRLSEKFTWSNRAKQQAQAFIFSSGRFLQSCHGVPRSVAEQLGHIIDLVVRDFIMVWYVDVTDDMTFPNDVKLTMLNAVGELCHRIMGMNLIMFLAADASEAIRHHLRWFQELSDRIETKRPDLYVDNATPAQERERLNLVDIEFQKTGDLHVAAEEGGRMELEFLRHVSKSILSRIMQSNDYHSTGKYSKRRRSNVAVISYNYRKNNFF